MGVIQPFDESIEFLVKRARFSEYLWIKIIHFLHNIKLLPEGLEGLRQIECLVAVCIALEKL